MVVVHRWYTHKLEFAFTNSKAMDYDADAYKLALLLTCYTPDQDAHEDFVDLTNELGAGCGYCAGGDTLCGEAATTDATPRLLLDANDAAFVCATFTVHEGATYNSTPACTANDALFTFVCFGACETVTAGTFTVAWDCSPAAIAVICPTNL